jgi:hypothetical protein
MGSNSPNPNADDVTMDDVCLSIDEAFDAAYLYMKAWWKEVPTTELVDVLSSSQLGAPRLTVDPAAWEMWLEAIGEVIERRKTQNNPTPRMT